MGGERFAGVWERAGTGRTGLAGSARHHPPPISRKNAMTRNRLRRDTPISQLIMLGPAVAVARSWLAAERFDAVPTFANPGRSRAPLAEAIGEGLRRGEGGRVEGKDRLGAVVEAV